MHHHNKRVARLWCCTRPLILLVLLLLSNSASPAFADNPVANEVQNAPHVATSSEGIHGATLFSPIRPIWSEQLQHLAEHGDANAQEALSEVYFRGDGVPVNKTIAFQWDLRSAHQGNALAEAYVGWAYKDGIGVKKNFQQAEYWLLPLAKAGEASGQFSLGDLYLRGHNSHQSFEKAYFWLLQAAATQQRPQIASKRDEAAKHLTSHQIRSIQRQVHASTPAPQNAAFDQTRRQAERGDVVQQASLANMYEWGFTGMQSYEEAYFWYRLAASPGTTFTAKSVLSKLTVEQVRAEDARVKQWTPTHIK